MLSILIPTYNYNIEALVAELHAQSKACAIEFEILCYDDASTNLEVIAANKSINSLENTTYIVLESNVGRSAIRNRLAKEARYDLLLFLDADVMPKSNNFIHNYISNVDSYHQVLFGGFTYDKTEPHFQTSLRGKYGLKYEQVDAEKRNLSPYRLVISANFLVEKSIFIKLNSLIPENRYGLDNVFGALLKTNNINILHLNNEVYHNGLEDNISFINKSEQATKTLLWMLNRGKVVRHSNNLLKVFEIFKTIKINFILNGFYKIFYERMKKNLVSNRPNLYILQLYKLSYMCHIDLNNKHD